MRICCSTASHALPSSSVLGYICWCSRTGAGGSRRESIRQMHVWSWGKVMNLAVVRTWSQASSGVVENSLFLEISKVFTLPRAGPFFYDPHMKKGHLDILSPSTCSLDLGQLIDQRKGETLRGFQMSPYKSLNMRKCTTHSPPVITEL